MKKRYDYAGWGKALLKSLMPGGKWDKKIMHASGRKPPCALCAKKMGYNSETGANDGDCKTAGCPIALVLRYSGCNFGIDFDYTTRNVEEFYIMMGMLYDSYFAGETKKGDWWN